MLFQLNINHTLQDCPMIRQILTGNFDNFIATRKAAAILIAPYKWKTMAKLELKIWKELLSKHTKHELAMFLVRFGYVITRPYFKRKKNLDVL